MTDSKSEKTGMAVKILPSLIVLSLITVVLRLVAII